MLIASNIRERKYIYLTLIKLFKSGEVESIVLSSETASANFGEAITNGTEKAASISKVSWAAAGSATPITPRNESI